MTDTSVSIILEECDQCAEIFRFDRLGTTKMAWSPCGGLLAFGQDSNLVVRGTSGKLRLEVLKENVHWLGFDGKNRLWSLAGKRLEARAGKDVHVMIDGVESAAASQLVTYCRRDDFGWHVCLHDGIREQEVPWSAGGTLNISMRISASPEQLTAIVTHPPKDHRLFMEIVSFDVMSLTARVLAQEEVSFALNGGPRADAVALRTHRVLACYENGQHSRVWEMGPHSSPIAISPEGFEVFDFSVDSTETRLAIIASDIHSAIGSSERQLLVARKEADGWRFLPPVRGIYDMPRWRHDGTLEILFGNLNRWSRRTFDIGAPEHSAMAKQGQAIPRSAAHAGYDLVKAPSSGRKRDAGVILLPRLHQQFTAGVQSFFFHHAIFAIGSRLALDGYDVVAVNGPGSIGRGQPRRECDKAAGSYFSQLKRTVHSVAQQLRDEGCHSIGMLVGSLAAVPALRMLGADTPISACAFVAPLFEASIPATEPWKDLLAEDPLIESLADAASHARVPLLVTHGARDELAPLEQVTRLCNHVFDRSKIELVILEDEGHIFRRMASWRHAQQAIEAFFVAHLSKKATNG